MTRDEELEKAAEKKVKNYAQDLAAVAFKDGFRNGANWERERAKGLVEAMKDIIRNSKDIVAKKLCSRVLTEYQGEGNG